MALAIAAALTSAPFFCHGERHRSGRGGVGYITHAEKPNKTQRGRKIQHAKLTKEDQKHD